MNRKAANKLAGVPVYDGPSPVKVTRARVLSVDKVKHTVNVVDEDNYSFDGLAVAPTYVNSNGGGNWWMPEVNSVVYLMFPSKDRTPFILAGAALPRQLDEGDESEDPNDFRMNRPVLNEGDQAISTQDGNYIYVRRGGVIEIGSTQTSKRYYIPLNNLIRDFCENYELLTTGGSFTFYSRTSDTSKGTDRTPVELRLQVKEFAQDDPIIDVGLGRIQEEDDEQVMGGDKGAIIGRININNRFKMWVDRDGNIQSYTHGNETRSLNGVRVEYIHKNFFRQVRGLFKDSVGSREVEIARTDTLHVGRDRELSVSGNVTETIQGQVTRTTGQVTEEIQGDLGRVISGAKTEQVMGTVSLTYADGHQVGIGGDHSAVVGGQWKVQVSNSNLNDVAGGISVTSGELQFHDVSGNLRLTAGGVSPSSALAELQLKPSGTILLKSLKTLATVEMNSTGISIKTAAGEISLDSLGTVCLGPSGRGAVITTLTHPVDYVTGAPILGSSSVAAGGIPSPTALASTFVSSG